MRDFTQNTLRKRKLDIVVQNLATMQAERQQNSEGDELTLGTNLFGFHTLGRVLLENGLLKNGARHITVVSAGHHLFKLDVPLLQALNRGNTDKFDGIYAYSATHRARTLLTKRWASEFPEVVFASVHPGWVKTPGLLNAAPT